MSLAEIAAREGLTQVGARPPLPAYLRDVWRHRPFIQRLARYRIQADNAQNRLGMGWIVVKPTIDAIVYGSVFGILLGRDALPGHYILFLVIGVFFFDYFSGCFGSGSKSIIKNANLVRSLSFPRMCLPLALVAEKFLTFMPIIGLILAAVLAWGIRPELEWLQLIPLVVLFTMFNAGLAMVTARLTVHFRDLTQLLPFVSRILFYTSGVFFSLQKRFGSHPTVMTLAAYQPIHEFLTLARSALLDGPEYIVPPHYWLYATIWSVSMLIFGAVFFWVAEERYGRVD